MKKAEYMGGAIAPGIGISMEALFDRASKLPRIELTKPDHVVREKYCSCHASGNCLRLCWTS